jgi:low temperature requirement protein LtrA
MVDRRRRPLATLTRTTPTSEGHRATTFELLFDLVYVFAATQVTALMADQHSPYGVAQGLILLALLWSVWSGYTYLANVARADEGLLRVGMATAMASIFIVALTIPEAFHDSPGGLNGPIVLVSAYLFVRCIHLGLFAIAARGDRGLRHQVRVAWVPLLAAAAFMIPGALLGGAAQTALFATALLVDWGGHWLSARHGSWRVPRAGHLAERHGLFVILAIGESVISIGVGASQQAISTSLLAAAVLGLTLAILLWWLYFDTTALAAEHRLIHTRGPARVRMGEAYTYGHYPIIAGIITAALGVEGVLAHADQAEPLGGFYAAALYGGLALYLAGHLLFRRLTGSGWATPRAVTAVTLLALLPIAASIAAALAALLLALITLASLVTYETLHDAEQRRALRGHDSPLPNQPTV